MSCTSLYSLGISIVETLVLLCNNLKALSLPIFPASSLSKHSIISLVGNVSSKSATIKFNVDVSSMGNLDKVIFLELDNFLNVH